MNTLALVAQLLTAAPIPAYILTIEKPAGTVLEVLINDVPLGDKDSGPSSKQTRLGPWLLATVNTLAATLTGPAGAAATVKVMRPSPTDPAGEALATLTLEAGGAPGRTNFKVFPPPPSEFWPTAQAIPFDDAAKKSALGPVLALQAAADKKDAAGYKKLLAFKLAELERSMGAAPGSFADAEQMAGAMTMQRKLKLKAAALEVTAVAGGKLLRVAQKSGPFVAYVAPIGGQWTIVR